MIESLEDRTLLSVTPASTTTLKVSSNAALLGQNITVTVSVKGTKHAPKVTGGVEFFDNGQPLTASGNPVAVALKHGKAKYVFGPGDAALFTGTHQITAEFLSGNTLPGSTSAAQQITITEPTLTTSTDGLGVATMGKAKGKPIKAGQTARVVYTGFLASSGTIFDYATANHGAGSLPYLSFKVFASPEAVITGFDEGTVGMRVGETRVLDIPSTLGYGPQDFGTIPGGSELIFLVTLKKISK